MSATVATPAGPVHLGDPPVWARPAGPFTSRVAYAAAHVIPYGWADNSPTAPATVDWDTTLAFRRHLWSWGLGVAEAMDTAQRGMGLDWAATRELIVRSSAEAATVGGRIVAGAGTDHVARRLGTLAEVIAAYTEQIAVGEDAGATVVIMASRQLAALATSPDDYANVNDRLLTQVRRPVVLHWLGEAFDPALAGYWGSDDLDKAADTVV
ncbi:MAG: hypothetical protein QOI74_593, partial [Micromonosporaceae bacterium]|nr:hypothetical protein [Micromonosporaceae bacterium]